MEREIEGEMERRRKGGRGGKIDGRKEEGRVRDWEAENRRVEEIGEGVGGARRRRERVQGVGEQAECSARHRTRLREYNPRTTGIPRLTGGRED